ncbi:MAG: hypothetical protein HXM38_02405 [Isoptericola variabilis]|uniref:hypothetical protein n=1 Tax=Pauljensenia sp. UMB3104 TaxID=3046331 RepID=UPI001CAEA929|nr:hypothetical protein [Pauljensenia sp. UMB3104]MBF1232326.1 hypothetical protein [Isoptericola variabilis]MBF1252497.1 hypothetical protein [Isoptericola variabilis]MDK7160072.1 hypothetical protein [Pauljensenia sp. UMB3104]
MSATMVSVTVIDSDGTSDFAAPEGTTVAGLCAMLEIDLSLPSVRISYADGRPLEGGAVLGRDLPAGSTIALSSRVLSAQQLNEASARQENQWLSPALALVGFCFLILGAVSSLCLLPLLGDAALVGYQHVEEGPQWARAMSAIPLWVRALCSLICCVTSVIPLFASRKVRSRPMLLLLLPALAGYSAIGFVAVAGIHALTIAPVVGVWVALIVSLAVVSLTVTPSALSALIAWVSATVLVTIGAIPFFSLINIAPLSVMVGVYLLLMAPRLALRVPDSQLVDASAVQTIASRIRQPPVQKPSPVTGGRMATVLGHTEARNTLLVVASSIFILAGGFWLPRRVVPVDDMGQGIASLVLIIAAIIVLLTAPRATRTHLGHILPRLTACALLYVLLFGDWITLPGSLGWMYPLIPLSIILILGIVTVIMTGFVEPKGHAALVGTILDFIQTFCTFALLPAAFMSSGLFLFAWRAVL